MVMSEGGRFRTVDDAPIEAPERIDWTLDADEIRRRRVAFTVLIDEQIREHDAWGVLFQASDCDVQLFGVDADSVYAGTAYGQTAYLVLDDSHNRGPVDAPERLVDLLERAKGAEKDIKSLVRSVSRSAHGVVERHRLNGKAEGVGLAISYIREALHEAEKEAPHG